MALPKGTRVGNAGKGRKKGVPNKTTALLKEMAINALLKKGGQKYFEKIADEEPVAFMTFLGKVLPTQVTGEGGGPIQIVTGVPRDEAN